MNDQLVSTLFAATQILFAFAFGACVGSLINVLVYRMPRDISVVRPASRCPSCNHLLSWRENIPVLGWLLLRGRCRFCKARISPEYPIVEAFVGLTFVLFYALWYLVPDRGAVWLGFDWSAIRPEWAENGWRLTWPVFVTLIVLVSSLIAMTIIDARTFTIPLALAWAPTVLAFVAHPLWAGVLAATGGRWRHRAPDEWWALATPGPHGWPALCAALGALVGLLIANVLLGLGLLRRSFEDYDEWEAKALAEAGLSPQETTKPETPPCAEPAPTDAPPPPETAAPSGRLGPVVRLGAIAGAVGVIVGGIAAALAGLSPVIGAVGGALLAVVLAGPLGRRSLRSDTDAPKSSETPAEMWIQYPNARREVLKELLFLAPCLALAVVGWYVGGRMGAPWAHDPMTLRPLAASQIPLWLNVLGGVALGYLVGGGVVWAIRIFGTLGFGKEAMGLGDVHLLAAVGACLGWIDAVLAFFLAPFIALYIVLVQAAWTGGGRRAMPYGPYLAVATVIVVLAKGGIEQLLSALFGGPTPINIP